MGAKNESKKESHILRIHLTVVTIANDCVVWIRLVTVSFHSDTETLFIFPSVAHPITEKSYSLIKLPNPQSSILKSD